MNLGDTIRVFAAGVIAIGMATALLAPGRQTIGAINAVGSSGSGLLKTAING